MNAPFLVCAAITATSAVVSLGFPIAAIPGTTGPTRTLASYACARSFALTIVSAASFTTGSNRWLEAVRVAMIVVRACDAIVGTTIKDMMKTIGPAGMALANLAALVWFLGQR